MRQRKAGSGACPAPNAKRPLSWRVRLFVVWPLYAALAMMLVVGGALIHYTVKFPDPMSLRQQSSSPVVRILARDATLLARRGSSHQFMPLSKIPQNVIAAVVATEDRRFFSHFGVDPFGLLRASLANLRAGRFVQGGSTLTQQLAKNLFLSPERTLSRKFQELLISLWLEVRLTKNDILELYLNRVYFGGGAYGIEAASQRYFDKSARYLDLLEAAMIAGLLKAPSRYSPRANPGLARKRTRTVLRKMYHAGFLSKNQYKRSTNSSLHFAKLRNNKSISGLEYAIDFILERLPSVAGTDSGELIVETTIDANLQKHTQHLVTTMLNEEDSTSRAGQAAVVVLDPKGEIRALVGGRNYRKSQYNRAAKAKRQPGSAFKTFVYLAALENGLKPTSPTMDLPVNIKGWRPRNIGGRYRGNISMRTSLTHSVNSVAVRLHMDVGPKRVVATARRLGITSRLHATPSLALGTSEVTLLELTGAYGVFANDGRKTVPHVIRRIRMSSGRILYNVKDVSQTRIVSRENVGDMNDMLNAVIVAGTGKRAALARHPMAGKTGTSQDFRDAWFVGYTAHLVTGVWVGNDRGRVMNKVTGGGLPARIWHNLMSDAHAALAPQVLPGTRALPPKQPLVIRQPVLKEVTRDITATKLRRNIQRVKQSARQLPPMSPTLSPTLSPTMPKEQIGEDFIARALRGGGKETAVSAWSPDTKPANRSYDRDGMANMAGLISSARAEPIELAPAPTKKWWKFDAGKIARKLGLETQPFDQRSQRMSLGGTPPQGDQP